MLLWRISNHASLNGAGGIDYPGRWHLRGMRVVYCAASPPGALIEVLVHLELDDLSFPRQYQLLKVKGPEAATKESVDASTLPVNWQDDMAVTARIGDVWLRRRSSALLEVPSAIMPETSNWLLNPEHPDTAQFSIEWHHRFSLDGRLLRGNG
jgi:RES domain-containing protein